MELTIANVNWLAVAASVVLCQIISTLWFTVFFGRPWAEEYGASSAKQHTQEIPLYTYGIQLLCTVALVVTIAVFQTALGVNSVGTALEVGLWIAVGFSAVTILPGQAFLKRWRVAAIAAGSQAMMILATSLVLGLWR